MHPIQSTAVYIRDLPHRGIDSFGSGEFGASRGKRLHKGIDYACAPGTKILSGVNGLVTKLGYPYAFDRKHRYVEITDTFDARHRIFYVKPCVKIGYKIRVDDIIGESQNIAEKHETPGKVMKNHVHYEILDSKGPINPDMYNIEYVLE